MYPQLDYLQADLLELESLLTHIRDELLRREREGDSHLSEKYLSELKRFEKDFSKRLKHIELAAKNSTMLTIAPDDKSSPSVGTPILHFKP